MTVLGILSCNICNISLCVANLSEISVLTLPYILLGNTFPLLLDMSYNSVFFKSVLATESHSKT